MLGLFHALNREIDTATSVCQDSSNGWICHGSAIAMGTIADWMSCRVDEV